MATNTATEKLIEPYVDLGTLLLIDRDPIDTLPDIGGAEQLAELTRKNAQFLFNKIWTLPRKIVQDATCAQLPAPQYALPREKPIPKPREPTKWERFAKAKGIVKQKPQSNKVWDETTEDWKPRWGYNKANDETKDWLIEIPDQADPYKDYFAERSAAKRERVSKQEMQRLKNVANAEKAATGGGGGGNQNNQNSIPQPQMAQNAGGQEVGAVHGKKQPMKREMKEEQEQFGGHNNKMQTGSGGGGGGKRRQQLLGDGKPLGLGPVDTKSGEQLTHQLDRAKRATASLGKFQPALKGEKRPRGTGIKRKFEPNESDGTEERKRQMDILARLQAKKQKLTTTAAVTPSRLNSVNEHIRREEKRSSDGGGQSSADGGSDRPERKKLGKAGRSKSQIDRQQHFQRGQKRARKSGFHGGRSKAGKATAGRHSGSSGGGGGGGGGKGRRK